MIFEDDAIFNENFEECINKLIFPENFNIVFIGGRFTKNFTMPLEYCLKSTENVRSSSCKKRSK
jgi:GR25 family glycosyltransferase involved in LPS biosynthesis